MEVKFLPFPIFNTKRLVLRQLNHQDCEDLFSMQQEEQMSEYTDSLPVKDIEQTNNYISKMNEGIANNKWIIWAICLKDTNKVIGTISIWGFSSDFKVAELGYGIHPLYQNKGYMSEALEVIIDYAFSILKLNHLQAYTDKNNANSVNLLNKFNFAFLKEVIEAGQCKNQNFTMHVYNLENSKKNVRE